jgi:hypothetical protein
MLLYGSAFLKASTEAFKKAECFLDIVMLSQEYVISGIPVKWRFATYSVVVGVNLHKRYR